MGRQAGEHQFPGYKATRRAGGRSEPPWAAFWARSSPAGWGGGFAYFLISLGTTALTIAMFQLTAPLQPAFLPVVFAQGFVATLFFGWLPLYLPELFPTRVRATGSGLAMNSGRFATAVGVLHLRRCCSQLWAGATRCVGALRRHHLRAGHDRHLVRARHQRLKNLED